MVTVMAMTMTKRMSLMVMVMVVMAMVKRMIMATRKRMEGGGRREGVAARPW
jgi:hypothetical protein